jgi:very-short-patch-repair endonuclease
MPVRKTIEEFIRQANIIHNNIYDYSLSEYINTNKKIKIICKKHGVFEQTPHNHLNGKNCSKCKGYNKNTEEFIEQLKEIHDNKYDYSLVNYINNISKIIIICKKHGEFKQVASMHLSGHGCSKCKSEKSHNLQCHTKNDFIKKSKLIHNNRYDYSLVNYFNTKTKVNIICKKHGKFIQAPDSHLSGSGCPKCMNSKGEIKIENYLINNKIYYFSQYKFDNCKFKRKLPFDFYLPDKNICIEFDGEFHYRNNEYFGGEKALKIQQLRDNIKNEYCKNNNIELLRIKYTEIKNIENIINKKLNNITMKKYNSRKNKIKLIYSIYNIS